MKVFLLLGIVLLIQACNSNKERTPRSIYTQYCASCHGKDGRLMSAGAKDLSASILTEVQIEHRIRKGSDNKVMRGYENLLNDSEIKQLVRLVQDFKK